MNVSKAISRGRSGSNCLFCRSG
eukprot:COSAG05_NODE_14690_length_390_cov_0.707904_1_plen_22_part_01